MHLPASDGDHETQADRRNPRAMGWNTVGSEGGEGEAGRNRCPPGEAGGKEGFPGLERHTYLKGISGDGERPSEVRRSGERTWNLLNPGELAEARDLILCTLGPEAFQSPSRPG